MTTARTRLTGLVAVLLLLGILVGLPAVLLAIGGNPLPSAIPSGHAIAAALTSPDDGTLALAAITIIAWAAWVFLAVAILLEVAARIRGITAPHLPGLHLPQSAARGLVGAALLLFVALPTVTPRAAAAPLPATVRTTASAPVHGPSVPDPAAPPDARNQRPDQVTRKSRNAAQEATVPHTVQHGESLWSIARDHLGSGQEYPQISRLNRDLLGQDPGFLRPGWVLELPAPPAVPPPGAVAHTVTVTAGDTLSQIAQDELNDATRWPRIAAASRSTVQPDGEHLTNPNLIKVGWTLTIPTTRVRTVTTTPSQAHRPDSRGHADQAPAKASPKAAAPVQPAHPQGPAAPGTRPEAPERGLQADTDQHTVLAPWMLTGFTGAGTILAGCALLALRRRRREQFRHRRPGRTIPVPDERLAPVEKTITTLGPATAPTVQHMDALLRRLAARRAADGKPMPPVTAVELTPTHIVLHLREATSLNPPWQPSPDQLHWACAPDVDLDGIGPHHPDAAAPFPLLVTVGASDQGHVWLLNCEDLAAIRISGDPTYGRDFARYLAAELALNPWSDGVRVDCIGIAGETAPLNPHRIRCHQACENACADALTDAVAMIDRAAASGTTVPTARTAGADDDAWPARLLLVDAAAGDHSRTVQQLLDLITAHPAQTGTAIVLTGDDEAPGVVLDVSDNGRVTMAGVGLDLVAVGLTSDEAHGCAAVFAHSDDLTDVQIPAGAGPDEPGWRSFTNAAGALRPEHTRPRNATRDGDEGPDDTESGGRVLDCGDEDYLAAAATTRQDLQALSPQVPAQVGQDLAAADPTLDEDVQAWFDQDCRLPRLTLLGPVTARTRGDAVAVAKRRPYATELLAYLATRAHGATPTQLADAFSITAGRARTDIKMVRDWLGVNPRTGLKHLPNARESAAAKARGIGVYQVDGVLLDADLFRRLRARGEARGPEGLADLRRALTLVEGLPFDQLRAGGWSWLYEGDRLDQHMLCAIVDVAHLVTTASLQAGHLQQARAAAELAALAAPHEEIPKLDLAAVAAAEGHQGEADRILRDDVCNQSENGQAPMELSERTQEVLRNRDWLRPKRAAS